MYPGTLSLAISVPGPGLLGQTLTSKYTVEVPGFLPQLDTGTDPPGSLFKLNSVYDILPSSPTFPTLASSNNQASLRSLY